MSLAPQELAHQALLRYLQKFPFLEENQRTYFCDQFEVSRIKKRQYIVQPGFIAAKRHFVVEGAFRSFVVGDSGSDHTIAFAIEDWWITDYNSYIYQKPATLFVAALEDSLILHIDYEKEKALKAEHHHFEKLFREMAERGLAFQQRRMISNLTQSAEERYDAFVAQYPNVVQRLPQYAMASYLGMTTEFLSRIRNRKVKTKS